MRSTGNWPATSKRVTWFSEFESVRRSSVVGITDFDIYRVGFCVDELCSCEKHHCEPPRPVTPFTADTTYRTAYLPRQPPAPARQHQYGADGVPVGIDPKTWREYVAKYGVPPE